MIPLLVYLLINRFIISEGIDFLQNVLTATHRFLHWSKFPTSSQNVLSFQLNYRALSAHASRMLATL